MIYIGLGSNISYDNLSCADTLRLACEHLRKNSISIIKTSSIWRSAPVPPSDQDWYNNAVIGVHTNETPQRLLKILREIEEIQFGRIRSNVNEARVLDLDLLDYNGMTMICDDLTLPHVRMHERAFVLCPLQEIAPNWQHPITGNYIDDDIRALSDQDLRKEEALL